MASTVEPQDETLPGTVFTPRQVRLLKITVVTLGVLILAALVGVVAGMIRLASSMSENEAVTIPQQGSLSAGVVQGSAAQGSVAQGKVEQGSVTHGAPFVLPEGAEISSMALDGDRLALHITSPEGPEIVVIDVASGAILSRVTIGPR